MRFILTAILIFASAQAFGEDPYNIRSALILFRMNGPVIDKTASEIYALASNVYRVKKNAAESVNLYASALTLCPQPFYYYELGNALLDTAAYADAISCYQISILLDFDAPQKAYYNMACAASLWGKGDLALFYLKKAVDRGFTNASRALADTDLAYARTLTGFDSALKGKPQPLPTADFRMARWGMSFTQVKKSETIADIATEDAETIVFQPAQLEKFYPGFAGAIRVSYFFDRKKKLWKGAYEIGSTGSAQWKFDELGNRIRGDFDRRFGLHRELTDGDGKYLCWVSHSSVIMMRGCDILENDGTAYGIRIEYESASYAPFQER